MPPTVRILDINPGSDGDGRKWPKHHYTRNDEYYKERVATNFWIKDLPGGPEPDVTYRLNQLPHGYGGFERVRPDGERIDYFVYGHPHGRFDSVKKFYPHFKHLMDYGGPIGCKCELCPADTVMKPRIGGNAAVGRTESERSTSPPQRSRFFTAQSRGVRESDEQAPSLISPFTAKRRGRPPKHGHLEETSFGPHKSKLVDSEGTPDVYESLIAKLKESNREDVIDVPIEEHMSPDWRSGDIATKELLKQWQNMPRYVPRIGEVVLFVRNLDAAEEIAWDASAQTFRRIDRENQAWLEQPKWEAGVVTQMPQDPLADSDLVTDENRERGVNYSGFRVEPLSEPGNDSKSYTKQHKHVPLHVIRPFTYWRECLQGVTEKDYHPSIRHALMTASSFCVLERFRFKGTWPNATVFARGVYVGSELVILGDVVRLQPRPREQRGVGVTDVMEVSAIRLRFVNLDLDEDGMSLGPGLSYQICLHISGRIYTLDPSRSLNGIKKLPIKSNSGSLPAGLGDYGQWYCYSDPSNNATKVEMPYTRVLGRCFEGSAIKAWFRSQLNMPAPPLLLSANANPIIVHEIESNISRGLKGVISARRYSEQNDKRLKSQEGKAWFWADTRIEQLDLHEVNGRYVGVKYERNQQEIKKWRTAIKALDGKKGALEEYHAAKKADDTGKIKRESNAFSSKTYGMVASSRQMGTESSVPTDAEDIEERDAMDIDEESGVNPSSSGEEEEVGSDPNRVAKKTIEVITLSSSDDEEELATIHLAEELARKIRSNDPRAR